MEWLKEQGVHAAGSLGFSYQPVISLMAVTATPPFLPIEISCSRFLFHFAQVFCLNIFVSV